ncbi:DUF3159 domain-containing protein [Aeromicrobium sp. NPDC092404]|uniref:DUF3159 domain-containing protein n=1 Tax=Aeromicrobium sp. NPDC092404 TaxID=3154976 RepID=UPI003439E354
MTPEAVTVEAVVRAQLAKAFGGRRGIVEGAVPTVLFTVCWIISHDLRTSLTVSIAAAVLMLLVRLLQRSTTQFVFNALFGIGIAAFIASRTGEARDVFLPGILLNAGTGTIMIVSILVGWPLVGFLIGSATGDPTAWHDDRALVKLCSRLTWVLVAPNIIRVAIQLPLWATDHVALLGSAKLALGWPLYVASFAVMAWMLGRDRTPIEPGQADS